MQRFESNPIEFDFLLRHFAKLEIAWYQRGYAWGPSDIEAFIHDVQRMLKREGRHFFGSLIGVANTGSKGVSLELVDGQQRCTTVFLSLLAAARGYEALAQKARRVDQALAARAADSATDLLEDLSQKRQPGVPKFQPAPGDRDALKALFLGEKAPSGSPLTKAFRRLKKALVAEAIFEKEQLSLEQQADSLDNLVHHLRQTTEFILITSSRDADIFVLFESLNTRGKDLTHAELLRTRALALIGDHADEKDATSAGWSAVVDLDRGTNSENKGKQFLQDYYNSFAGERASEHALLNDFTNRFFPTDKYVPPLTVAKARDLRRIAESMAACVEYVKSWKSKNGVMWPYSPSKAKAWVVDRHTRLVAALGYRATTPLLLAAKESLEEVDFAGLVTVIEIAAFRYDVCSGEPNKLSKLYIETAKRVRDERDKFSIADFKKALWELVSNEAGDEKFRSLLKSDLRYEPGNVRANRRVLHFLTTLDQYDANAKRFDINTVYALDVNDIEHISPQSLSVGQLGREDVKHSIGNLTFWGASPNRSAQDDPFDTKRPLYKTCNVGLTRELADLTAWDESAVELRTEQLIDKALLVWSAKTKTVGA